MAYCRKCRATVGADDRYCSECGAALKGGSQRKNEESEVLQCVACKGTGFKSKWSGIICDVCGGKGMIRV